MGSQERVKGGAPSVIALDVERTIGPQASRTHFRFPFAVPVQASGLEVLFSYDPKILADEARERELIDKGLRAYAGSLKNPGVAGPGPAREPLNNLLTLSLDDPLRFRGCAHRHDPQQRVTLDIETATPGFIAGAVEPGTWAATVSVHAVVTDRCTFRLQVRAL